MIDDDLVLNNLPPKNLLLNITHEEDTFILYPPSSRTEAVQRKERDNRSFLLLSFFPSDPCSVRRGDRRSKWPPKRPLSIMFAALLGKAKKGENSKLHDYHHTMQETLMQLVVCGRYKRIHYFFSRLLLLLLLCRRRRLLSVSCVFLFEEDICLS